ncbi:hypothetical protein J5N97_023914 [Dioscorea zingiberensis]|uniref:TFIIS N-terminal domain-containing protein n=1 Tax=Dioscorea zingiberensis TaxID=325984 RepID=A0A9D5C5M7_9LILI|nr:hypothetical protein J5N97_023914 [Dioscorea zingiberensis]
MTLEDFFTLTEMKDGLATLARVEELILMMEKQKDSVVGNVSDAARQWSTVARTLAITGSENCLDHFIQLKGLFFLNQWLLEAQKCTSDIGDNIVDELVNSLLASLERLPIDRDKSSAFGIATTLEQLLDHKNIEIKEKARSLIEKLNNAKVDEVRCQNMEKGGKCINDQLEYTCDTKITDSGLLAEPPVLEDSTNGRCQVISALTESHTSDDTKSSDNLRVDKLKDVIPTAYSNSADANAVLGDAKPSDPSLLSKSCQDDLVSAKESSVCPAVVLPSTSTNNSLSSETRDDNNEHFASDIKDGADCSKEMEVDTKESNPQSDQEEICNILPSSVHSSVITTQKAETEPPLCCNVDSGNSGSPKTEMTAVSQSMIESSNSKSPEPFKTVKERKPAEGCQDISCKGILIKKDAPDASSHRRGGVTSIVRGSTDESNLRVSKGMGHAFPSGSSKALGAKDMGDSGKRSELGLDCEIDALELARQVAIEVEREVVDYREPFCSSPDVNSREIMDASSPDVGEEKGDQPEFNSREGTDMDRSTQDSETDLDKVTDPPDNDFVEGNQDQSVVDDLKGDRSPTERCISDSDHSSKENNSRTSRKIIDLEEHKQEKSSSTAQELSCKSDKNICNFDLNEDASTEDLDCLADVVPSLPVNLSAPIAVVAASKGAPGLPVAPLHFGGELGWRGSAATSAFRPASPRKTPDSEKAYSSPKEKSNLLEIDLNVAEDEDDVAVNHAAAKQAPVSSGLPSGDSSIEVSSRRAEKFKLDLNSLGDEDAPSYMSNWRLHQNFNLSPSPASSSSSRQPSMRDFDLNDKPSIFEGHGSHSLHKSSSKAYSTHETSKLDEPVIMIMGSRVAMEKKGYDNQSQQSFPGSGLCLERTMATRTSLPFAQMPPPAYGYHGLPNGPPMPTSPALYGPGSYPHMVDFKGATVIPQVFGSSGPNGVVPTATATARPPFLVNAASVPSSSNGVWSSQPGLDLNSSMSLMENGRWEGGSLKQAYTQGTLKRKEPECGWEPYGLSYKQVTPWQ